MFLVLTTSTAGASSTCSLLKSAENTSPVGTFSRCLRAIFVLFLRICHAILSTTKSIEPYISCETSSARSVTEPVGIVTSTLAVFSR